MQILPSSSSGNYSPNFQRFIKVKGELGQIDRLRTKVDDYSNDLLTIVRPDKNDENGALLYIMTGTTSDKFLDLIPKMWFRKLKNNLEKYIGEKPEKMHLKTLEKEIDADKFIL